MAQITLKIIGDISDAQSKVGTLKAEIATISTTPVKINVDASALEGLSAKALTLLNSQAKVAVETEKTRQAQINLSAAMEKTKQAQAQVASEADRTRQAYEKTGQAIERTEQLQIQSESVDKRRALLAEQMAAAYERAAISGSQITTSGSYTPTAMQSQIEAVTGVSRSMPVWNVTGESYSAADSAAYFKHIGTAADEATPKVKSTAAAIGETSKQGGILGDTLGNIAAKMALWQVMGSAIAAPIRYIKEAVQELKAVDDQMVEVRKVTNFTAQELDKLGTKAYEMGAKYGVAASEYLESTSTFARAGYEELSDSLSELSTKAQIVGDMDAETANQFLLSVDAAYKYKGSVTELTKVLDGANEIDNNYATSIEKISEGLGKVSPIASQAHVGVNELTAAIGTITSVTQRSGTEAATALRALFLNIIGDTKTEIADGATWTAGEIEGLRDVLNVYSKDAVEAAEATGSVINPMEAIAGLAQSMKDGLLTEQQLMSMVSDIGGKLRTSQLLALIQNWDMYESMLADYGDAVGSADKEVANAMDSWSRKLEVLKSKVAEFLASAHVQDFIEGIISAATGLVDAISSDAGQVVIKLAAVTGGVVLLNKAFGAIKGSGIYALAAFLKSGLASGAFTASEAFDALTSSMLANPLFWAGAGIVAVGTIKAIIDGIADSTAEASEKANENAKSLSEAVKTVEELGGVQGRTTEQEDEFKSALDAVNAALGTKKTKLDGLTEGSKEYVEALKALTSQELQLAAMKAQTAIDAEKNTFDKGQGGGTMLDLYSAAAEKSGDDVAGYYGVLARIAEMEKQATDTGDRSILSSLGYTNLQATADQFHPLIDNLIAARVAMAALGMETPTTAAELEKAKNEIVSSLGATGAYADDVRRIAQDYLPSFTSATGDAESGVDGLNDGINDGLTAIAEYADKLDGLASSLKVCGDAMSEFSDDGALSYSTLSDIIDKFSDVDGIDDYISRLTDAGLTADDLSQIMGELAIKKAQLVIQTNGVNSSTEGLITAMLKEYGVANNVEVAQWLMAQALKNTGGEAENTATDIDSATSAAKTFNSTGIDPSSFIPGFQAIQQAAIATRNAIVAAFIPATTSGYVGTGMLTGADADAAKNNTRTTTTTAPTIDWSGLSGTGGNGGGGGSATDPIEEQSKAFKEQNAILEHSLYLMKQRGASAEEQLAAAQEIQNKLHEQAQWFRNAGEDENSQYIRDLQKQWWDYVGEIDDIYQTTIDDMENSIKLAENNGAGNSEILDRYREIMDAAHRQAEYYRSMGIAENHKYIQALKDQWWDAYNAVIDIYKADRDELTEVVDNIIAEQTAAIDAAIDAENERYNAVKDENELEQQRLDLLKAQADLVNAQNERTIFDVASRRWIADKGAVDKAQEALDNAQSKLDETEAERQHQAIIDALEAQKAAIEDEWEAIQKSWETPTRTIEEILSEMSNSAMPEFQAQVEQITAFLAKLGITLSDVTGGSSAAEEQSTIDRMKANSAAWNTSDAAGRKRLEDENYRLGTGMGWTRSSDGIWYKANGERAYDNGGMLHGRGVFYKDTDEDEYVLAPEFTKMLSPTAGTQTAEFLARSGIMTGASGAGTAKMISGGSADSHDQKIININGVPISAQDAETKTVAQFVRELGTLTLYGNE